MDELTPSEYSLAYQARRIIEELTAPGLSPDDSLDMIRATVGARLKSARHALAEAQRQAERHDPAEPDGQSADTSEPYCGWCGSTVPAGGLEWDSDDETVRLTGDPQAQLPAWFCTDVPGCLARHRVACPPHAPLALEQAREQWELAAAAAEPAIVALTSLVAATRQASAGLAAQQGMLALAQSRLAAPGRPAPLPSREVQQARRFAHTLSNPANRQHLISRSR